MRWPHRHGRLSLDNTTFSVYPWGRMVAGGGLRGRVVDHAEHVKDRHRGNKGRDDLPDPSDFCVVHYDPGSSSRSGMVVFFDAQDDDAAAGVGHGRDVASQVPLLCVGTPVQGCLEIQVERFLRARVDQRVDMMSRERIEWCGEESLKATRPKSYHLSHHAGSA